MTKAKRNKKYWYAVRIHGGPNPRVVVVKVTKTTLAGPFSSKKEADEEAACLEADWMEEEMPFEKLSKMARKEAQKRSAKS